MKHEMKELIAQMIQKLVLKSMVKLFVICKKSKLAILAKKVIKGLEIQYNPKANSSPRFSQY